MKTSRSLAPWRESLLRVYHPRVVAQTLTQLDAEPPSYAHTADNRHLRVLAILAVAALSLWLVHYLRFYSVGFTLLQWLHLPSHDAVVQSPWRELAGQCWWLSVQILGYGILPWLLLRFVLKLSLRDMGVQWGDTGHHFREYVWVAAPILVFVACVSQGEAFVNHYPFYREAGRSWADLLAWELMYVLQFIMIEFFFRGFLVNGLRPVLGVNAIYIMCVPYMMIHLPKLAPEAFGAIAFGFLLGVLALKSRSIWGGVAVHVAIALSMDLAALWQKGAWPQAFLPG